MDLMGLLVIVVGLSMIVFYLVAVHFYKQLRKVLGFIYDINDYGYDCVDDFVSDFLKGKVDLDG